MREFQEKKHDKHRIRKILYSKLTIAVLAIIIVFFVRTTWGVYQNERESAANTAQAIVELNKLKEREAVLKREVSRLKTDEGKEEEIRSQYSVTKPNEQVLILIEGEKEETPAAEEQKTWWQRLKEYAR